ncbi:hypothetical protein C8A00DRAFT_18217 [Chaetomidium leptoderma]|uniref:Ig-like domain-containing protein n=1 Tax=Chaetomidium leptoderma TaxID=669021 RepID=A0AAN6VFA4_9PEZI|nr:hypothetical protein C8A00DRAFT_18217 [Chaetomidium leptoderma]
MTCLVELILCAFALHSAACSAASIQRRQYQPDSAGGPRTPQQCIEASLTNPTWDIYSPTLVVINGASDGTQGDIGFLAANSATGVSANCTAKDIDLEPRGATALGVWHNCSIPDLSFQFDLETLDMRLRGSWLCDNSSSLVFMANGSWEVPLIQGCFDEETPRGLERLCIMGNSQVPAGLSLPIAIHPQLPLLPYTPRERAQRCVDRSYDPEWQINDLLYQHHFTKKNNMTSISYDLSLDVTNISDGQSLNCSVTVDLQDTYYTNGSTPWVRCNGPGGDDSSSNTTFIDVMLDTDYGVFGIRQAWECSDGVAGVERDQFDGIAYTSFSLDCGRPTNLAVRDSQGLVIGAASDYNCSLLTPPATFSGYVDKAPPMPHTYYSRSCTITSISDTTALALQEYRIESAPIPAGDGNNKTSSVLGSFTLYNLGPGDAYKFSRMPVVDDGAWHDCTAGQEEALPWQLVGCQYLLDRASHRLGFQVQWYCDDRDATNAILFNATVEQQLPGEVCATVGERETCGLPVDVAELDMPISSLTWAASGKPMDRGPTLPWI